MKLKHIALAVGVLTIAAGGGGIVAADGGDRGGGWRNVQVEFTPTVEPAANMAEVCDPANQCVTVWTVAATQAGDFVGSTVQGFTTGYNGVNPAVIPVNVTGTFTGSIKGCGTGGVLYSGRGNIDFTTGVQTYTYKLVEGTGTGNFAGISGTFHQSSPQITGTVRCQRPR